MWWPRNKCINLGFRDPWRPWPLFTIHKLTKPAPHKSVASRATSHANCHSLIRVVHVRVDLLSWCCNRRGHNHNHSTQEYITLVKANFEVYVDSSGCFWQKRSGKIFVSACVEPHMLSLEWVLFFMFRKNNTTQHNTQLASLQNV